MAKKTKWGRLAKLTELSTKVSSSYLGQRVASVFQSEQAQKESLKNTHLRNAERIVDTMAVLKGAAMKVGQSLAVLADSMDLPPDMARILSKLNDQATPVPFEDIMAVIEQELGPREEHFSMIDPEPLGTASLAQAHAAQLKDGRHVVIKILHDGVEESVETDLKALKSILLAGRVLRRSKEEIDMIFEEIHARLLEELDYEHELKNLERFAEFFADIPHISSPKPIHSLCTKRILVMDRLIGMRLEDFVEKGSAQAKQKAADALTHGFHEMVYVFRALHADPHGGNFLFKLDGSISLIDFGCVKYFSAPFLIDYGLLGNYIIDGQKAEAIDMAEKMGLIINGDEALYEDFWEFVQIIAKPFRAGVYEASTDALMAEIRAASDKILRHGNIRASRDIIFLHRSLTGTYSMLRKLEHQCNYEDIRRRYVQNAIQVFKGAQADRGWDVGL